jgi:hypothetical protein
MPVIYFQGQHDAATPPIQARYHFDHEATAPRYYVGIDLAGHAALTVTLAVGDCRSGLWDAITADLDRFAKAVGRCDALEGRAHVTLDYAAAEPRIASPSPLPASPTLPPR